MNITLEEGDFGTYLLVAEDGRDILIQVDYDFPGVASHMGWSPESIATYSVFDRARADNVSYFKGSKEACEEYIADVGMEYPSIVEACTHDATDGTIDCDCGMAAIDFIVSAQDYLDDHIGDEFEDPGYFSDEE